MSRLLGRGAQYLLVALCLTLPFEAKLFQLGFLVLTIPELFLYVLLACWLGSRLLPGSAVPGIPTKGRRLGSVAREKILQDPVRSAVALWMLVSLASAIAATSHRLEVVKFTLRTTSGCCSTSPPETSRSGPRRDSQ